MLSHTQRMMREQQQPKREIMELLTVKDLATLMGWAEHTVYQRRYRGDSLPRAITIGQTIRFRKDDVEAWLEEHADRNPAPAA